MKDLFEQWRNFMEASEPQFKPQEGIRDFTFTKQEALRLNHAISKVVNEAMKVLGGELAGSLPNLFNLLIPVKLDTSQKDATAAETPLRMVAEGDVVDLKKYFGDEAEERHDLRQRYHGEGGEIEKSSPRAAKGLEKGLGQMSAAEFEETGYVMRVPEEVLEDFNVLVQETKKTGELYEQARSWYHDIRALLDQETNNDRDATLLGLLIATYSPRAKFALNLAEAAYMFKAVQKDVAEQPALLKQYLETFPGAEKREPGDPRGFTKAHKVPNFALNLIAPKLAGKRDPETGEMTYNDMYMWNSTIDTWMIDAFYPLLKKASTTKEWDAMKGKLMSNVVSYRYMAQLVANEARKLNLLPHELQAIVWVSMQIRQTGDPDLGVTTEFAVNQIRESMKNIRKINNELELYKKEFEEKSWLGTVFDEIDNKGFEEAGKFILGIKDEKGKFVAPGVRSITSSGKKGSAYKYYPQPPKDEEELKAKAKAKKDKKAPKPKPEKKYASEEFAALHTHYVMNNIIQMPTGKFNNLYDSIMLYLDPDFTVQKAVEYLTGRFDPTAKASGKYFKEQITAIVNKILSEKRLTKK